MEPDRLIRNTIVSGTSESMICSIRSRISRYQILVYIARSKFSRPAAIFCSRRSMNTCGPPTDQAFARRLYYQLIFFLPILTAQRSLFSGKITCHSQSPLYVFLSSTGSPTVKADSYSTSSVSSITYAVTSWSISSNSS